jgi:hypothetical protein
MRSFLVLLLICFGINLYPQELNFSVRINAQKVQVADQSIFETLSQTMTEFLNNQKWTDDIFSNTERINCNLLLTIQEESGTTFKADLAIQSTRPVFKSSYESPMLNHIDRDITFSYQQYDPLQFSRNTFTNNLSAVLSFYAYIILGLDYDSYSPRGGENYFQIAQEILNNIPQGSAESNQGWRSMESTRNRYWLIENLLSPRIRVFRESIYNYHRQGLDLMSSDVVKGRNSIKNSLEAIAGVTKTYPNAMIIQMFANAKGDEINEIFKPAPSSERLDVGQLLSVIDPSNANRYRALR